VIIHPTVVAAIDFSSVSATVAAEAARLARGLGAHLALVHVTPPLRDSKAGDALLAARESDLEEIARALRDPLLHVHCRVEFGSPAEEIIREVEIDQAELLVVGTHGRKGIGRFLMGSVADELMHRAPCPVVIVRSKRTLGKNDRRARRLS
jgi:nucleotide-binding universal stress UspA family protein